MRTHRFDPLAFVAGLAFVAIGAATLADLVTIDLLNSLLRTDWWLPASLVMLGLGMLLTVIGRSRDADQPDPDASDAIGAGDPR